MAVLTSRPGLKVNILVHGEVLTEHVNDEEPEDNSTVINYLEAQSGN